MTNAEAEAADDFTNAIIGNTRTQIHSFQKNIDDHPYIVGGGEKYKNPESIYE